MQAHQRPHARAVGGLRPGEADRRRRARARSSRPVAGRPRARPRRRLLRAAGRRAAAVPPAPTPDPACADALDSDVLFATDSAELTAEGRATLDRLAPAGAMAASRSKATPTTPAPRPSTSRSPNAERAPSWTSLVKRRDRRLRADRAGLRLESPGGRQRHARGPVAEPPRGVPQAVGAVQTRRQRVVGPVATALSRPLSRRCLTSSVSSPRRSSPRSR